MKLQLGLSLILTASLAQAKQSPATVSAPVSPHKGGLLAPLGRTPLMPYRSLPTTTPAAATTAAAASTIVVPMARKGQLAPLSHTPTLMAETPTSVSSPSTDSTPAGRLRSLSTYGSNPEQQPRTRFLTPLNLPKDPETVTTMAAPQPTARIEATAPNINIGLDLDAIGFDERQEDPRISTYEQQIKLLHIALQQRDEELARLRTQQPAAATTAATAPQAAPVSPTAKAVVKDWYKMRIGNDLHEKQYRIEIRTQLNADEIAQVHELAYIYRELLKNDQHLVKMFFKLPVQRKSGRPYIFDADWYAVPAPIAYQHGAVQPNEMEKHWAEAKAHNELLNSLKTKDFRTQLQAFKNFETTLVKD
jgi:hypothetical protein